MMRNVFRFSFTLAATALCAVLVSPALADAWSDGFVPVGDLDNPARLPESDGRGSVGYLYYISALPVTAGEYVEFLNTVDGSGQNLFELYDDRMTSVPSASNDWYDGCMITWNDTEKTYDFSADPDGDVSDWANRPVNSVSWFSAARYANWLTSGDTESGAYLFDDDHDFIGIDRDQALGQYGRVYVLPTEDEWYKAAYYDPKKDDGAGGYWFYPTKSDVIDTDMANYSGAIGHPTDVGTYDHPSAYGTFDQAGNVAEWTESAQGGERRYYYGGWFGGSEALFNANARYAVSPTQIEDMIGFRVGIYIPEPGTATMLLFGAIAGLLWRRRR